MPTNVVKSEKDEELWKRAKSATHESYPNKSEDDDSFWAIVQTIYQKMKKGHKEEIEYLSNKFLSDTEFNTLINETEKQEIIDFLKEKKQKT